MAEKKQDRQLSPVMGGDDGFLKVRSLEDSILDQYLSTYSARIDGYKLDDGESYTRCTMKVAFMPGTREANANMWAYFIAGQAHPTAVKRSVIVQVSPEATVAYVSWAIWKNVKYMESKKGDQSGW
jgi:hypothetical protein